MEALYASLTFTEAMQQPAGQGERAHCVIWCDAFTVFEGQLNAWALGVQVGRWPIDKLQEITWQADDEERLRGLRREARAAAVEKYPRAGKAWSAQEDEALLQHFREGRTVEELVELLERAEGGVRSRLRRHLGDDWYKPAEG